MSSPAQNYAILLSLARRHREGEKPLSAASPAVRKEVVSGMPKDPGERPPPKPDDPKPAR